MSKVIQISNDDYNNHQWREDEEETASFVKINGDSFENIVMRNGLPIEVTVTKSVKKGRGKSQVTVAEETTVKARYIRGLFNDFCEERGWIDDLFQCVLDGLVEPMSSDFVDWIYKHATLKAGLIQGSGEENEQWLVAIADLVIRDAIMVKKHDEYKAGRKRAFTNKTIRGCMIHRQSLRDSKSAQAKGMNGALKQKGLGAGDLKQMHEDVENGKKTKGGITIEIAEKLQDSVNDVRSTVSEIAASVRQDFDAIGSKMIEEMKNQELLEGDDNE